VADWIEAENELVSKQAYYRAKKIPEAAQEPLRNWLDAKDVVQWRLVIESHFAEGLIPPISRPYLAMAAHYTALTHHLNSVYELNPTCKAAGLVAVLDGAPESARLCPDESAAAERLAAKDATFYEYCRHALSLFRAKLLEAGKVRSCQEVTDGDRAFEDGCLGVFTGPLATCDAITAALHLRGYLTTLNYRSEFHWQEELHLRVVIASGWEATLSGLEFAFRDEIVVEERLFSQLEPCAKRTLLAAGVRLMKNR
jgi:hypothetical protein